MKEEYYHLTYWDWDNDEHCSRLCVKLVLIPAITMEALTTANIRPAQALSFIIKDGQEFILNADNFHSLERVYGEID